MWKTEWTCHVTPTDATPTDALQTKRWIILLNKIIPFDHFYARNVRRRTFSAIFVQGINRFTVNGYRYIVAFCQKPELVEAAGAPVSSNVLSMCHIVICRAWMNNGFECRGRCYLTFHTNGRTSYVPLQVSNNLPDEIFCGKFDRINLERSNIVRR